MAPTIEANSLFDIVKLADDPPLSSSDVNFQTIRTPLVLYIARVPGTNGMMAQKPSSTMLQLTCADIFLTTMKPLQKVVTASDVESCLYYVHLVSIEDEKLLRPTELNALGGP